MLVNWMRIKWKQNFYFMRKILSEFWVHCCISCVCCANGFIDHSKCRYRSFIELIACLDTYSFELLLQSNVSRSKEPIKYANFEITKRNKKKRISMWRVRKYYWAKIDKLYRWITQYSMKIYWSINNHFHGTRHSAYDAHTDDAT